MRNTVLWWIPVISACVLWVCSACTSPAACADSSAKPAGQDVLRTTEKVLPMEATSTPAIALPLPDGFVRVDQVIPDVVLDMRYASDNNFVGCPIDGYLAPVALLTREAAAALAAVADQMRPMGLRLCIYDAYRPESACAHFVRWAKDLTDTRTKEEYYPSVRKEDLFAKGYIAKRSSHSRGSCVDLTLVDASGASLDMGGTFDLFDPISSDEAKGLTAAQIANRALLRSAMEKHGFKPYSAEWWHFTLIYEPYPKTSFSFPVQE